MGASSIESEYNDINSRNGWNAAFQVNLQSDKEKIHSHTHIHTMQNIQKNTHENIHIHIYI